MLESTIREANADDADMRFSLGEAICHGCNSVDGDCFSHCGGELARLGNNNQILLILQSSAGTNNSSNPADFVTDLMRRALAGQTSFVRRLLRTTSRAISSVM